MFHTRVAVALAAFALLPGCSSSTSGNDAGTNGGGSGSGSGGSSNAPSRTTVTCAQAASAASGGGLTAGSWGTTPSALQQTPSGGTFCGTIVNGTGPTGSITIVLSSDWDQQIFDFYKPLVTTAGCTLDAMTTTTGSFATSGTSYTCTNGGSGTITASADDDFLMLTYSAN